MEAIRGMLSFVEIVYPAGHMASEPAAGPARREHW